MAESTDPMDAAALEVAAEPNPGLTVIVSAVPLDDAKRIRDEAVAAAVDAERAEAQRILHELSKLVETASGAYGVLRKHKLPPVRSSADPSEAVAP